jgi:hypothetical protein
MYENCIRRSSSWQLVFVLRTASTSLLIPVEYVHAYSEYCQNYIELEFSQKSPYGAFNLLFPRVQPMYSPRKHTSTLEHRTVSIFRNCMSPGTS